MARISADHKGDKVMIKFKLASVDAWNDGDGWYWNNQYMLNDDLSFTEKDLTTRKILSSLRKMNYLSDASKGRVTIEDISDVDYCFEIQDRKTREPLFCLSTS